MQWGYAPGLHAARRLEARRSLRLCLHWAGGVYRRVQARFQAVHRAGATNMQQRGAVGQRAAVPQRLQRRDVRGGLHRRSQAVQRPGFADLQGGGLARRHRVSLRVRSRQLRGRLRAEQQTLHRADPGDVRRAWAVAGGHELSLRVRSRPVCGGMRARKQGLRGRGPSYLRRSGAVEERCGVRARLQRRGLQHAVVQDLPGPRQGLWLRGQRLRADLELRVVHGARDLRGWGHVERLRLHALV